MITPLIANLGPTELLIIFAIIILIFGASKLPELARGSGRALRIFKAETKGLHDDDDSATMTPEQRELQARQAQLDADIEAERIARERRGDTTA